MTESPPSQAHAAFTQASGLGQEAAADPLQLLASIVESSDDAIISKDLNGRIMSWNRGAERIFGYTAAEAIGQSILMIIPPERHDEEPDILERIRRGERIDHFETIRRRKDGALIDISLTVSPLRNASGTIVGASKIGRDITDRRAFERNSAAAADTALRLAAIVENSDDAIISKDLKGVITSWNKGAERLFGYTADEVIGKSVLMLIPPERHNEEPGILERIRRGERIDHYETVRRCKDGTLIDISLTVSPVRDRHGVIVGASKISRDITQRKQAEATRQLLLGELNHRVKNTLATVQAIVQQTLRTTRDPGDFASRFSGRIQSLARVHALLTSTTWRGADLRELIRDQLLQGPVDETRLTAWGPTLRLGAETTLHMALMLHELGTNSTKYGALSVPNGRVAINWSVKDEILHLQWVERGGPPVSAPVARGFGTTLIEQSAKSEGGRARMLCEAEGVTWQIELPLPATATKSAIQAAPAAIGTLLPEASPPPLPILAGLRFLVIEDEPLIALSLQDTLETAGAQVAEPVGTEKEALQALEVGDFDAALLDANLHGRPVGEIAAALTRSQIPFLFVTGYGKEGVPGSFKHIGVVTKPFTERQLLDAVSGLILKGSGVARLKPDRS